MPNYPSRREVISTVPAAAWLGAGLTGAAFGQAGQQPQQQRERGRPPQAEANGGSIVQKMMAEAFQGNQYALPALPYPPEALEPHISAKILEVHHNVHHQGYVKGLNKAVKQLTEMTAGGGDIDTNQLDAVQRDLSFNAGGHFLHTLYWATMGSGQGGEPVGELAAALSKQFGSVDSFKKYFTKVGAGLKGSGWAVLMYEPVGDRLFAYRVNDHDMYLAPGSQPLLPLDVWEHAYYLEYGPGRAEYIQAWWNVVNWNAVNDAYKQMRSLRQEASMITTGR